MKKLFLFILLSLGLSAISYAGPYDDWPDDAVCMWLEMKPTHAGYLGEAKKRGISCEGGIAVKTKTTSKVTSSSSVVNSGSTIIGQSIYKTITQGDAEIYEAQMLLNRFSYHVGSPNGQWTLATQSAIQRFYQESDQSFDGKWSSQILSDLKDRRLITMPRSGPLSFAEEDEMLDEIRLKDNDISKVEKTWYQLNQLKFAVVTSDEVSPPFCYPTPQDCIDTGGIYQPEPANAVAGDFNGDGLQDLAIAWEYLIHTTPRKKTPAHVRFYLNDGKNNLISSPEIYALGEVPLRHKLYRMTVNDFNSDGRDDLFVGSMGVITRIKDKGMINDFEPNLLLLSTQNGQMEDASHLIEGQENGGMIKDYKFSHATTSGDINCDGFIDIYTGTVLLIGDGKGRFSNKSRDLPEGIYGNQKANSFASTIADFNGDGCGDVAMHLNQKTINVWMSNYGKHMSRTFKELKMEDYYGKGNIKVNDMISGDLDGDGDPDLVAAITRANPYYLGRKIVIFINEKGELIEKTKTLIQDDRDQDVKGKLQNYGEGTLQLIDHDRDGDLDIIDSTAGSFEQNGRFGYTIFENDGTGHFTVIPESELVILQEDMFDGYNYNLPQTTYGYPIDIDGVGRLDYVSFMRSPASSKTNNLFQYGTVYGYTVLGRDKPIDIEELKKVQEEKAKRLASPKVKPKELEASLTFLGEFDLKKLGENTNPNLAAFSAHSETFDINQDGHDDLIIPITSMNPKFRNVPYEFAKPILLFWDNEIKEYVIDKEVQKALPSFQWPRRIRSSINPKTGFTEIFIADTGLDLASYDMSKGLENLPPNCGGQNHLITYDPSSGKVDEIPLPKLWDYPHGLATGDLNGDQITDYVLFNSPYIKFPEKCLFKGADYTNESYILYSNKKGGYDKTDIKLNYQGVTKAPSIQSAEIIVDENNQTYLVLGSEGSKGDAYLYLMRQDSKTSFTETSKIIAPSVFRQIGNPVYGEILVADVDADGTEEVIAASNTMDDSIALWVGRYVQLFDIKNGRLVERPDSISQSSAIEITKGQDWCHHLFFNEQTAWNETILTCTNLQPQIEERGSFYVSSNDKFQIAKMKFNFDTENDDFAWMKSFYPVTIDQETIFVGRRISGMKVINGVEVFNSIKLYLLKPPFKLAKASNAFDGSYSFTLNRGDSSGGSIELGSGILEISDGKISVSKKSRTLKTSSTSYYDTFEGQIDKEGNINASFEVNALTGKGSPELTPFSGSMKGLQIKGMFYDLEMNINIVKLAEASNAFDGSYSFTISHYNENEGSRQIGNGYIEINNGIMTVAKDGRTLDTGPIDLYDSFEGQIDKKGNIVGSLKIDVLTGKTRLELVGLNGSINSQLQGEWDSYFDVILKLGEKE